MSEEVRAGVEVLPLRAERTQVNLPKGVKHSTHNEKILPHYFFIEKLKK